MKQSAIKNWESVTIAGLEAAAAGDFTRARTFWSDAIDLVAGLRSSDARTAAGWSNLGVGHALTGTLGEAEDAFRNAQSSWRDVLDHVREMAVPVVGTSSAFHFRLASQNLAAFEATRRARYAALAAAGQATTDFNLHCVLARLPATAEAARLSALLSDVFGSRSPEVQLLDEKRTGAYTKDDLSSHYARKIRDLDTRRRSMLGALSDDCRALESAVQLTTLVTPAAGTHLPATAKTEYHPE